MEGKDKISQTDFELHNDGGSITSNCWKVTWYEDYVEVILSGEEQFDEQVILYFDGTKELQQLTDIADIEVDYPSGEKLDESRVITEQSFEVDLNDWGEVRFVSYLPTYDTLWEDVSFVLAKDNQIVYHFPAYFENNSTENDSVGMFDSVDADYAKSERQFRVNGAAVPFPTAHQRRPLFIDFVTLAHAYSVHSFQDGKNVFCQ